MPSSFVTWDTKALRGLETPRMTAAIARAVRKAAATSLRDMRSEASKRVRARKRLRAGIVHKAIHLKRPRISTRSIDGADWGLNISGKAVSLAQYPHRQTKRGVSVEVNKGKRTLVKSAFITTLKSGRRGIWVREGKARLPIRELLGSRPVDALLHEGEAEGVQERGRASFASTFARMLPIELGKGG